MKQATLFKVGMGSCGLAAGAGEIYELLKQEARDGQRIMSTACLGHCYAEPMVEVVKPDGNRDVYGHLKPGDVQKLLNNALPDTKLILSDTKDAYANEQQKKQVRIVLRNAGIIDPDSLEEYVERDGYSALEKACLKMTPQGVIDEVKTSGLRGRGGAGFPAGVKWQLAKDAPGTKKYVICNADEGDPGAFMDRSVLEGDPHSILEGMALCAFAIGADEGYVYCRAEYPLAVRRLRKAIRDAEEAGYLGENIFGSDFSITLRVKEGAGAFVCGEETALIASIEGKRGMPRLRPPYPAVSGLWGKPTNNNNVETYANVAWIIHHGAAEFTKYGTEKSRGTKVFALAGKVRHSGLVEVPMGMTLREIIYEIGGGIQEDRPVKAVQLGGPSGGCISADMLDTPVDYESLKETGAIMGSGGMVVMDDSSCMVNIAAFFLHFTQEESCGKCTFCRVGTKRMLEILERIQSGNGKEGDIEKLEELSEQIIGSSLCGLGKTAPNPVLTTLRYFRQEYEEHIRDKHCAAGVCTAMIRFDVVPEICTGCTACARACPVNAVSGKAKETHHISQELCIRCGACYKACRFDAIRRS